MRVPNECSEITGAVAVVNWSATFYYNNPSACESCGQSYKHFTLVNYDSRVVRISNLLVFATLEW